MKCWITPSLMNILLCHCTADNNSFAVYCFMNIPIITIVKYILIIIMSKNSICANCCDWFRWKYIILLIYSLRFQYILLLVWNEIIKNQLIRVAIIIQQYFAFKTYFMRIYENYYDLKHIKQINCLSISMKLLRYNKFFAYVKLHICDLI